MGRMESLPSAVLLFVKGKCCWGEVILSVGFSVGVCPHYNKKKSQINPKRPVLIFLESSNV